MYQFSNFERAEMGPVRLPQLADGFEGVLRVEKTFVDDTRYGPKFFCEFTVMSSNTEVNPPGQRVIWKQDMTKRDVADNALLQWAGAIFGVHRDDEATVFQLKRGMRGMLEYAMSYQEQNNFTQKFVCARAHEGPTKSAGRDFLYVDFWPYVASNGQ